MSNRRAAGDWVWLKPNTGFVGESHQYMAQIQHEDDPPPCFECDDQECREWSNLLSEPIDGHRFTLCHVPECRMLDAPYQEGNP